MNEISPGSAFRQEEYRTLPGFCFAHNLIDKNLSESILSEPERAQWYTSMGKDFMHIHHYCWAVMHVARGNRAPKAASRMAHYRAAVSDFDYVIRNVDSTFALKPEFHLKKGMTLRLMGDDAGASSEFASAIKLKSDYTPAYSALIDLHLDLGNREEAMKWLDTGLSQAPGSLILTKKKAELENSTRGPMQ